MGAGDGADFWVVGVFYVQLLVFREVLLKGMAQGVPDCLTFAFGNGIFGAESGVSERGSGAFGAASRVSGRGNGAFGAARWVGESREWAGGAARGGPEMGNAAGGVARRGSAWQNLAGGVVRRSNFDWQGVPVLSAPVGCADGFAARWDRRALPGRSLKSGDEGAAGPSVARTRAHLE